MKCIENNKSSDLLLDVRKIVLKNIKSLSHLLDESVFVEPLGVEEALGDPAPYKDFALQRGEEKLIEATLNGEKGQAFTSRPSRWRGTLEEVLLLPLNLEKNRAIFLATVNALGRHLGWDDHTIHCKDKAPDRCGRKMAEFVSEILDPSAKVGVIGYQPAIIKHMAEVLGKERVKLCDLNPQNIGKDVFGVRVLDGDTALEEIARDCRVCLITGSTLVNSTLDRILQTMENRGVKPFIYGTTGAIPAKLLGIERLCFEAQ
ncbi:Putative heavy-metal chelation [Acetomicrobium thermoterrenum DSM 13490]|uniref:Putative heavy-metal chelation n=1 Tax=Acetomicrobium thermoterrenum DSM 13490 TaxID=1120987 RepID=A0A1H3ENE8_9BACT|nr:DUF364 domain-containing protein [Acetomicrobium thermoterrenum]SDX80231.1 Putative heavy-metal chelation [Acetomicrobium thermoterrenum DSM 13490]